MKNLVQKYLRLNQFEDKIQDFEDLFLSHPNYPSLYAITDTFNLLSIENIAVKVSKEQINELPKEFLAIYDDKLVLVHKTDKKISIENEDLKTIKLSFTDFLKSWNGIVIAIETNIKIKTTNKKTSSWLLYTLPFIALISLSIYYNKYNFYGLFTLSINIIGFIISLFILQEKFGIANEITAKFCNLNQNLSCNSVLTSKKNKANSFLNFTDLPILFFSISLLSMLIQPTSSSLIIGIASIFSIPVLLYSIWIQKFQLKKWCVLCLAVSTLLILQSIVFTTTQPISREIINLNFSTLLFFTILVSSLWYFIKPLFEKKVSLENKNIGLNKFKRNFSLFHFLSKDITEYDGIEQLKGISFGDENAATKLTLILSPSCGHCHKAFEDGLELVQKFHEKIHLNILFNINPNNKDNPFKTVVENLLTINEQDPKKSQEAIIDWHINNLDLEIWLKKWNVDMPNMLVNQQIQNQYYWCLKNEFNYTPVKIINGKLYPENYEISELKYFINDIHQAIKIEKALKAV